MPLKMRNVLLSYKPSTFYFHQAEHRYLYPSGINPGAYRLSKALIFLEEDVKKIFIEMF